MVRKDLSKNVRLSTVEGAMLDTITKELKLKNDSETIRLLVRTAYNGARESRGKKPVILFKGIKQER